MPVGGIFGKAQGHQQSNVPSLVGQLLGQGVNEAGDALQRFKEARKMAKADNQYYGRLAEMTIKNQLDQPFATPIPLEEVASPGA